MIPAVRGPRISRRELLALGAAVGVALGLRRAPAVAVAAESRLDFAALPPGDGWPGWACPGVANLRVEGGRGVLEAGSDVFPCDPRPVAFAVDRRFADGGVEAVVSAGGAGVGLVLRRVGPRDYYAAILDEEQGALVLVRRHPAGVEELARVPASARGGAVRMSFSAAGVYPTSLTAAAGAATVSVVDRAPALQAAGDPGVLATARTLFPAEGPPVLPALGNLHLLPYGVQEGQAVIASPAGEAVLGPIRERSTAVFSSIVVRPGSAVEPTAPSVVAATNGAPVARGVSLRVATDVPASVEIEVSRSPAFPRGRTRRMSASTDGFDAVIASVRGLRPGRRFSWRARVRRGGASSVGPVHSFRVPPRAGRPEPASLAIASCAAQFGPAFDRIVERAPDVFVWQGDLNYPDTIGPLAQTVSGYAGIWRDFLANPLMTPILGGMLFAAQRDDHDYGVQDANASNLVPWGLAPWESLVERRTFYRFAVGLAEVWVLDQRRFKTDPAAPDGPDKTLLGLPQREWLLSTLAASRAPFKVVCSPCTLAPLSANARDGSWATGFLAERDLVLGHVRSRVTGRTIFVSGDTHWTMVYDRDGLFEARPCPLGIPTPHDITFTQPNAAEDARREEGVVYAEDERGHVVFLDVRGAAGRGELRLSLVREDGLVAYERTFEEPYSTRRRPPPPRRRRPARP
jgi:phosphodiesterase/alkaline phosphatase D-like protein